MTNVSVAEAKATLSDVIRRAQAGEEFTITRNGEPVARLGPVRAREGGFLSGEVIIHDPAWWNSDDALASEFGIG